MPELYGKPFKDELRAEIRELNSALSKEIKNRRHLRLQLDIALAKIEELEERIQQMEQRARDISTIATQEITGLGDRVQQARKRRRDEAYAAFVAANAA